MQAGILTAEHLITAPAEPLGKLGAGSQAERPMTRSAAQAQAAEAQSSVSTGNADSEPLVHEFGLTGVHALQICPARSIPTGQGTSSYHCSWFSAGE